MLQYLLFIFFSTTSVKVTTGCPGNYQYVWQPPTTFTHCNPVKTSLHLVCRVLVPEDNNAVTVDWYWSKNISECGKNVRNLTGRFDIHISRQYAPDNNADRITTDLTIKYPQTDTGYYWCQVNNSSYNGVFVSSNKAPVFDTGNMTICSGSQYMNQSICAIGSSSSLVCIRSTTTTTMTTGIYIETTTVIPTSNVVDTSISLRITTITSTSLHIVSTPANNISNTPVSSSQTSSNTTTIAVVVPSKPSSVTSNTPVLSGIISNTPFSDHTSSNTTTVAIVAVTVLILLATLVLVIAAVIIIIFIVVKRQPHRRVRLQYQFTNISKRKEDNKSYTLFDTKSSQSNKPSRPPSRPPPYSSKKETEIKEKPATASSAYSSKSREKETDIKDTKSNQSSKPSRPPPYSSKKETEIKEKPATASSAGSSKLQEKKTEIKNTKSNQLSKPLQPPSRPPPYSSKPQEKETEIKDKPITAGSAGSSEPQEKETEIKDTPVTTSSADSSSEAPTYAVLDWQKKVKPVTEPSPLSDTVIYTTIVKK